MVTGQIIGSYRVENVLRPYKHGAALLKVRYEGSYLRGVLCVIDTTPGIAMQTPGELVLKVKSTISVLEKLSKTMKTADVTPLLPKHVSSCELADRIQILGFFPEAETMAYLNGEQTPVRMDCLRSVGELLTHMHCKGIGHGMLNPVTIRKSETWMLPCPFFPLLTADALDTVDDKIVHDRKVFALMVADAHRGNTDIAGFAKRLASLNTYVAGISEVFSFIGNPSVSCNELIKQMTKEKENYRGQSVPRKRSGNVVRGRVMWILATLGFLILLSTSPVIAILLFILILATTALKAVRKRLGQ